MENPFESLIQRLENLEFRLTKELSGIRHLLEQKEALTFSDNSRQMDLIGIDEVCGVAKNHYIQ